MNIVKISLVVVAISVFLLACTYDSEYQYLKPIIEEVRPSLVKMEKPSSPVPLSKPFLLIYIGGAGSSYFDENTRSNHGFFNTVVFGNVFPNKVKDLKTLVLMKDEVIDSRVYEVRSKKYGSFIGNKTINDYRYHLWGVDIPTRKVLVYDTISEEPHKDQIKFDDIKRWFDRVRLDDASGSG